MGRVSDAARRSMLRSWVMALRASSRLAVLAVALLAVAGCGPSLRRVHQGNVYFERCYAADLDVTVPAEERRACWEAWHAYYQMGASPERIDHATERLAMLDPEQAEAIALATGTGTADETGDSALVEMVSPVTTPDPDPPVDGPLTVEVATTEPAHVPLVEDTQTHVQIVEEAERARAEERRSHRRIVAPPTTTPHCARTCRPLWEHCTAGCTADERGCVAACRRELTICSRGCY
jgi:hypothetical protein